MSEYLRNIPAPLRPTMQAARRTIKTLAPKGTKEIAYRKWPIRYAVGIGASTPAHRFIVLNSSRPHALR